MPWEWPKKWQKDKKKKKKKERKKKKIKMDSSEEKKKMNTSHDLFTRGESLLIFSECVLPARLEPKDIKILREKRRLPPTRSPVYEHICHMI